jgi:hypothetical protein
MLRRTALIAFGFLTFSTAYCQTGSFSGTVVDGKTQEPLIGATVQLIETGFGASTNVEGSYTISEIPANTYNIKATFIGYEPEIKYNVVIRSEGNIDVNFRLIESVQELEGVTVTSNPFSRLEETPLSIQNLSQQEIASYPGGNNDIAKVVQSLPGISGSVGGFRNDVIIRGGAPNENVYYLDGIEIPNINHFSTQGSAGGPVGLLNVSFFEGVTLTSTSFGAQYDNVLSGVLQFDQRTGNQRHFQGNARVGASETALTLEGPLFKGNKETSNTTYIVSARRSYLKFLFGIIGLPILPDYWDYQYKITHKINERNEIIVTGLGSVDNFAVNELEEYDPQQQAIQDQVPIINQHTNTIGASWKMRFRDNSGYMQTSVSNNVLNNEFLQYKDNINKTGLYFTNDSREEETKLRYSLTKFMGPLTWTAGASTQWADNSNYTQDLVNGFSYQTKIDFLRFGLFTQLSSKKASDRVSLSFGLRTDGNTFTNDGTDILRTLSPRIAASVKLDNTGRLLWSASIGRYFKLPPYTMLGFKDSNGDFVNRNAKYIRSDHVVTGLEYLLTPSSRLSVEGFLKMYDHYPVSLNDSVSIANKGGGFEVLGNEPVASMGLGNTYGIEFLYQKKFNGKIYAIAAITFYKSEFTGLEPHHFLPSVWDNGQLISLTGGYKFARNWEISGRFRYLGKTPYAPVDEQATLASYPAIIKDYARLGEVELEPFMRLDLRLDRKWSFKKFSLDAYIDVQNVTAAQTPSEPAYGLLRDASGTVIVPESLVVVNVNQTGTIIPSIGLVVNF